MFEENRWRFSLPSIAIPYLVLFALIALGLWGYTLILLRANLQAGIVDRLAAQARLIGDTVEQSLAGYQPIDLIDPIAERFASLTEARVTIIGRDGSILGESSADPQEAAAGSNLISRPEIQAALIDGVGFDIQPGASPQDRFLFVAVPVYIQDQPRAFVRLALPMSAVESQALPTLMTFTLVFVGIAFFALGAVWIISERVAQALRGLTHMANQLAEGSFLPRAPAGRKDETGALAVAFGRLNFQLRNQFRLLEQRIAHQTKSLDKRSAYLELIADVARHMSRHRDLDALLPAIVQMLCERLGLYFVGVYTLDEQNRFAIFRAGTGEAGQSMLQNDTRVAVGGMGMVGYASGSGEARVIKDVHADFTYVRNLLLPETKSQLVIPIKAGARVLGVLDFQCKLENAFDEEILSVLKVAADQLSISLQQVHLRAEVQTSLQESSRLSARLAQSSWAGRGAGSLTYDFDLSRVRAMQRVLDAEVVETLKTGQSVSVNTLPTSSAPIQAAGRPKPKDVPAFEARNEPLAQKSQLLTPLMVYGQIVGVVGVEENDARRDWTPEERALIEAVAGQVALALDNARLLEETQYRSEQLRLLQEVTATAAAYVELDQLLDKVSHKLLTGFNVALCSLVLFNPETPNALNSVLVVRFASKEQPAAQTLAGAESQPVNLTLAQHDLAFLQEVLQARRANVIYDVHQQPRIIWRTELVVHGIRTLVTLPLLSRGDLVGAILFGVADPERRFEEDSLDLLDQIGLQISSAIQVARSFEQTLKRVEVERQISAMTTRIRETLDIETVLSTAADELYKAGNLDEVIIQLVPSE